MTIECNKDDADRCIEIAQNALSAGNIEKAERFLLRAERLYPTARAKELLIRLRAAGNAGAPPKRSPPNSPSAEEVRRRKTPSHQPPQREYTQDQLEAVRRINTKCKDYYEILGKLSTMKRKVLPKLNNVNNCLFNAVAVQISRSGT